jgi:zinc/manganese transport system ATP-binding protein
MVSVRIKGLTAGYNGLPVIRNVSFEYEGYGIIQILGPNGAGKTTLLRAILGLIKPFSGHVYINCEEVTGKPEKAGRYAGYVPQSTNIQETYYPITLRELVECCYLMRRNWPRIRVGSEGRNVVEKALDMVGLPREVWDKCFWDLSGGQKQRGYIARALVGDPEILLMDEPFSNIDPSGRVELAERIGRLSRSKLVIITSHDPMLLLRYTSKILMINKDVYVYGDPEEVLRKEVAEKIYGRAIIEVREHLHILDSHR